MFFIKRFNKIKCLATFFLINIAKTFFIRKFDKKIFHNIFFDKHYKTFFIRKFDKKNVFATFFFEDLIKTLQKRFY
jgi:hypothetical protein